MYELLVCLVSSRPSIYPLPSTSTPTRRDDTPKEEESTIFLLLLETPHNLHDD
jgi:hypothetical protein